MSTETSQNVRVAGRFYVGTDGGVNAQQYTDMIMTALFESAKNAPQPLKTRLLEYKLEAIDIIFHYVSEAMADERRRVGRQYELQETAKARLMLPAGYAQRLDEGGVWTEA